MQYLITFLEGIISFISPCMLPMLPIYISYFGGSKSQKTIFRSVCFVAGFALVFCVLGLFAGSIGALLTEYKTIVNIVCGVIIILFGMSYLEILRLPIFKGMRNSIKINGIFSAFIFGMIYSGSLTPCVGAFLGSALMLASASGSAFEGAMLLLIYSLGLGIPFVASAVLLDKLGTAFSFIKRHYRSINLVCGIFLIIVGVMMSLGLLDKLLSFFA